MYPSRNFNPSSSHVQTIGLLQIKYQTDIFLEISFKCKRISAVLSENLQAYFKFKGKRTRGKLHKKHDRLMIFPNEIKLFWITSRFISLLECFSNFVHFIFSARRAGGFNFKRRSLFTFRFCFKNGILWLIWLFHFWSGLNEYFILVMLPYTMAKLFGEILK